MTKKAQINMTLIPLVLILAIIIGAGYLLIQGDIKLPKLNRGPSIRRLEGFPTVIYTGDSIEKQRRVITNQNELSDFLNLIDKTGLVTLKEQINFDKEVLVGVSSETEQPVGHVIKVKKLFEDKANSKLTVFLEETFPSESCNAEKDPHIAVDLVAITKTNYQILFDRAKKFEECGSSDNNPDETNDTNNESTNSNNN